jgi:hypothetical protein
MNNYFLLHISQKTFSACARLSFPFRARAEYNPGDFDLRDLSHQF